ncbi:hypothetical protein [Caldimonas brevitalea]|uniref:Uncharacterized protein n=1 Tax=Caldimonas brevitalea TaxID=413882 RepID=A0A0G3BCM4_9BURK|nr:hypothetical protein [Caldimonas brevitalea]AKJ27072.1 hypothetical protein AAW51_0381 [Caldimonas brevitalea]
MALSLDGRTLGHVTVDERKRTFFLGTSRSTTATEASCSGRDWRRRLYLAAVKCLTDCLCEMAQTRALEEIAARSDERLKSALRELFAQSAVRLQRGEFDDLVQQIQSRAGPENIDVLQIRQLLITAGAQRWVASA